MLSCISRPFQKHFERCPAEYRVPEPDRAAEGAGEHRGERGRHVFGRPRVRGRAPHHLLEPGIKLFLVSNM